MMDEATRAALRIALDVAVRDRDRADATIALLSEKLGLAEAGSQAVVLGPGDLSQDGARDVGPVNVAEGEFYGMSQTQAAFTYLDRAGRTRPQRTDQIVAALIRGGIRIGGKNPPADTIYKILNRDQRFHRPAPNTWGLSSWYPNAPKKATKTDAATDATVAGDQTGIDVESDDAPSPSDQTDSASTSGETESGGEPLPDGG